MEREEVAFANDARCFALGCLGGKLEGRKKASS